MRTQSMYTDLKISHKTIISPVCVCMCLLRVQFSQSADIQISQKNNFSPVCVSMLVFQWEFLKNEEPQISKENGFASVCFWYDFLEYAEQLPSQVMCSDVFLQSVFCRKDWST